MAEIAFPYTEAAVQAAAQLVQWAWSALAASSSLSAREQALYVQGLSRPDSLVYPDGGDPLAARVVLRTAAATRLEVGFAAYHLPSRIDWASARGARRSKDGRWYLVIPFTHGAYRGPKGLSPAALYRMMPSRIYQVARRLRPGERLTAGPTRGRSVHAPGMRPYVPRFARNVRPGYTHAAREERLERRPQGGGRGSYLTFRTMRQDSPGWWIPGREGARLRDQAERDTAKAVHEMMAAGVRQDVEAALAQGLGE
jgi:hypothetical protein